MTDRLIWRPNEVSLEDWTAMSREQQIKWWKDRQPPPKPKPHMKEAIQFYFDGGITQTEFCVCVAKWAAQEEIADFLAACPIDLMEVLKKDLQRHGEDESKWPRLFSISCYAPWVTAEEINEIRQKEQEQIWAGVRLLKKHLR